MVNKRISVDLFKEIQYLRPLLKHQRKVARHLGISRETVAKYWKTEVIDGAVNKSSWASNIDWEYVCSFPREVTTF